MTLTTVGYGDIRPTSPLGQMVAAMVMILGYSIIIVPTGLISVAMTHSPATTGPHLCPSCSSDEHDTDAKYCKDCGAALEEWGNV